MKFKLKARVRRSAADAVQLALEQLEAKGSFSPEAKDFIVEAEIEGESARDLNRAFLSALRSAQRRTTIRARWTSGENTTESFFDYVLRKTSSAK